MTDLVDLRLRTHIPDDELAAKLGKIVTDRDYNVLLTGPTRVRRPDGQVLAVYLPGVLTEPMAEAWPTLSPIRLMTDNRGLAAGTPRLQRGDQKRTRTRRIASTTVGAVDPGPSVTRSGGRLPVCRLTAWTAQHVAEWQGLQPLLAEVAAQFAEHVPDRYRVQAAAAAATHPDWVVPGTPFTTVTVNNCVDPATECMTKRLGWTSYTDLRHDDEILAYDPTTDTNRWEPLQGVFVNEHYAGDMMRLTSREWSALVTPDHRWPVRPLRSAGREPGPVQVRHTYELPRHDWALLRAAKYAGPAEPTMDDAFVRMVAWYFTEGSLRADGKGICLAQSDRANPQHVDAIRRDLKAIGARPAAEAPPLVRRGYPLGNQRRAGLWYNERPPNRHGVVTWLVTGDEVDALIACAPGARKLLAQDFLAALTADQAAMFVETCLQGDGTPERRQFYQWDDGRMDGFMAVAVLAGEAPTVGADGTRCSLAAHHLYLATVKRQTMYYEGPVWCPRTLSGHWVARRNRKVFITGNTYSTGVHQDAGDLEAGFSTLAVGRRGHYRGGLLVLARYRLAVDMHDGDLLLFDAHEWHGNTAMVCPHSGGEPLARWCPEGCERVSLVCYYRTKVAGCGSAQAEAAKAVAAMAE